MKDFVLVFLIGSSLWIDINDAFPTGAPESACETLTPRHGNIEPQRSENPYTVTATKNGNSVKVKISGIVGEKFEGFVMQARSAFEKNRLIEGKFTTRSNISQTINCQSGRQNTITQVNKGKKSEIITEWTPAGGVTEDVIFRATVAKTFALFWIKTDSQPVKISSSSAGSKTSEEMYDDCSMNKGCFGHPLDCVERQNCDIFVSYVDSADGVKFTMHGTLSSGQYMATGLSFDKRMGEDSVTECFVDGSRVVAQHSWNEGYSNRPDTQIPEGMYEWSLRNGLASCTWVRPYITYPGVKTINLKDETYYVLMAKGPMLNDRLSRHEVRIASQQAVNFTAYEMIEGAGADDAVKIHGGGNATRRAKYYLADDNATRDAKYYFDRGGRSHSHNETEHMKGENGKSLIITSSIYLIVAMITALMTDLF